MLRVLPGNTGKFRKCLSSVKCSVPSPGGAGARRTPPSQVLVVCGEMWYDFHAIFLSVIKDTPEQTEMAAQLYTSGWCLVT